MLDRARGALVGLVVGDALGGPLERLTPKEIGARFGGRVRDPVAGGRLDRRAGENTGRTAMALALGRSVAVAGQYDPARALDGYLECYRTSPSDADAMVAASLDAVLSGAPAADAAESAHRATGGTAGNGSLVRVAALALRYVRDPEKRRAAARADSRLTHFDPLAGDACSWLCDVTAALVHGIDPAELVAPRELEGAWAATSEGAGGEGAGFVLTTLAVAAAALRCADDPERGLVWAVNLGGDAAGNGAVAGALLGARFGARALPERWVDRVERMDEAALLAERLIGQAHAAARAARAPPRAPARDDPFTRVRSAAGRAGTDGEWAAELALLETGAFGEGAMLLSHASERDALWLIERAFTDDGIESDRVVEITSNADLLFAEPRGRCIGFRLGGLSETDFESSENAALWVGPRFDVPPLGLERASVGLVAATTRMVLGPLRTPNRVLFDLALDASGEKALDLWRLCLAEGDEMARFAVGYTLLDLGEHREAHEQLRHYSHLVRTNSWAWVYLGRACEALEDWEGAEYAYRRAIATESAGSFETDAAERLARLLEHRARSR